jgi:hypothetical protein
MVQVVQIRLISDMGILSGGVIKSQSPVHGPRRLERKPHLKLGKGQEQPIEQPDEKGKRINGCRASLEQYCI